MFKIAIRDSCGNALVEPGKSVNDVVVLDADLATATKTVLFKKAFPERHFDCGITEANMINVAAGRAFEQIRNTIGYPHLNVKICATHGGISVGEDGASHQCCEDFALMRSIPSMVVMSPSDNAEARQMIQAPVYHDENFKFEIGKGELLRDGKDVAIIANGILQADGISARVINMATIKPLYEEIILRAARDCEKIVTVEEHSIIGGLGEAICSLLAEKFPVPVKRIGINDEFGHSGSAAELLKQFGLCADNIVKTCRQTVNFNRDGGK